ncbi:MAG: ATP-binding protein [Deltaproteobacteria bacterium]|nr:ATP-binding protein [Deltaproteobacteria bacterium]
MHFASVPTLVTAILSLALGVFVLRRNKANLNRTFALWCFLTAFWQACWTLLFNVKDENTAMVLARLGYSGITFIPIVFFHFVAEFVPNPSLKKLLRPFYAVGGIFLLLTWSSEWYIGGVYRYYWGFYPKAGALHQVYLVFLGIMLALGLYALFAYRRRVAEQRLKVNQIHYVISSTMIYSLAAVDFLANYGTAYYPVGMVFTNLHAVIIAYAIVKFRLLDIQMAFKRSLMSALILVILLIPCFLILIVSQQLAFGAIDYTFSLLTLGLLVSAGFLFPKLRFMGEDVLERGYFKTNADLRETLLRSSREMVSVVDLNELSEHLVRTVNNAVGSEKAILYLNDDTKGRFSLSSVGGIDDPRQFSDPVLARSDPLVQTLSICRESVVREELAMAAPAWQLEAAARMTQLGAEVSVPIVSKEKLAGILNLGYKVNRKIYSTEDLEFLSTLANQAAIAVDNARLYDNLKQSQMTLRRADRLSSLGMLTAGLAHEIRNPLVAIRTFTQLLPERYDDAEFRQFFQGLALKEVDRICGLINDLLNFARPSRPKIAEENLNEVVDGVARILESQAKDCDVKIARDFSADLPKAWIDREQLKQVFMNLILNAIQAMRGGGSVLLATRVSAGGDGNALLPCVQVEIRDTGIGIPEENLEHIFDPFFTNKDGGSGLGLSISHQIVKEHGGRILVLSKIKEGTSFIVNLPLGKPVHSPVADPERAVS